MDGRSFEKKPTRRITYTAPANQLRHLAHLRQFERDRQLRQMATRQGVGQGVACLAAVPRQDLGPRNLRGPTDFTRGDRISRQRMDRSSRATDEFTGAMGPSSARRPAAHDLVDMAFVNPSPWTKSRIVG